MENLPELIEKPGIAHRHRVSLGQADLAVHHLEVVGGRDDVRPIRLHLHHVRRFRDGNRGMTLKQGRHLARIVGIEVEDDHPGETAVRGDRAEELLECAQAAASRNVNPAWNWRR